MPYKQKIWLEKYLVKSIKITLAKLNLMILARVALYRPLQHGAYNLQSISACAERVQPHETDIALMMVQIICFLF